MTLVFADHILNSKYRTGLELAPSPAPSAATSRLRRCRESTPRSSPAPCSTEAPLPIGGKLVVSPSFYDLTAHRKTILRGLFLKSVTKEKA